jgi:DNA-binding LacI/PurR family transcriptional regulator
MSSTAPSRRKTSSTSDSGRPRRVRLIEVARATGFSTATVSQALNGTGRLPESTRTVIRAASEELGYRPNRIARSLASGKTSVIGLAVSQAGGPPFPSSGFEYFIQVLGGATEVALAHGYALVLVPTAARHPTSPLEVELGGAIILDPIAEDPLVRSIVQQDNPVVTVGRLPDDSVDSNVSWVDNDAVGAALSAIAHLERAGAQRIGLIISPPTTSYARDCLEAYGQWCDRTGAERRIAMARGDRGEGAGFDAALELLDQPDPPDAIFAILDRLALGARTAADFRNLRVPEDILIASGIDSLAARQGRPAITAVNLFPDRLGHRAAEMLIAKLEHGSTDSVDEIVPTRLMPRASTLRDRH